MSDATPVVTCFLRNRGEVLVIRRSGEVGTYAGRWSGVSGYVEGDPAETARREIDEETGLLGATTLVRRGDHLEVVDGDHHFLVHPFLFECAERAVDPNWEVAAYRWTAPPSVRELDAVPKLWETYRRVAPTVETVETDDTHGAAYLSIRALEVLRDRAAERVDGEGDDEAAWNELVTVARSLLSARPSMAVLANRIDRVMNGAAVARTAEVEGSESRMETAAVVAETASREIERAFAADEKAAEIATVHCRDANVLTLSRSGTVLDALRSGDPASVTVLESRPDREGVVVAKELADAGIDVTLSIDAAVSHLLAEREFDVVLVGADTVYPDETVVNKVGTRTAAIAADLEGVPVFAVTATDKVLATESSTGEGSATAVPTGLESGDPNAVYDGNRDVAVEYPTFDATPGTFLAGVITERGVLDAEGLASVAAAHGRRRAWDETDE